MKTRTRDEPSESEELGEWSVSEFTREDIARAVILLAAKLGVEVWKTNATKHGTVEVELRPAQ